MSTAEAAAFIGLFVVFVVHAAVVGRWSGRITTLLERHGNAIEELKALVKRHDGKLFDLAVDEKALRIVVESGGTHPKVVRGNPEGGENAPKGTTHQR